jgi:hypothetical protein
MSIVNSEAEFRRVVDECGLDAFHYKFVLLGWDTLAKLAYSSDWVPGSADPALFDSELTIPILGAKNHILRTGLKRLFVAAFTMSVNDLKRMSERTQDAAPVMMPNAEKEARREALDTRLTGLDLEVEADPSFRLVDFVQQMHVNNAVHYVPWEDCTMRPQEMDGAKKKKDWESVGGYVKVVE